MTTMKTNSGLWIDHREATLVFLSEAGDKTKRIQSSAEKQLRRAGEPSSGPFEADEVPADDSREREYTGHLARYYDEIIASLSGAESILIMGPGEAKGELKKRFDKHHRDPRPITVETADRMTEAQLAAKVRHHFHADPPRHSG